MNAGQSRALILASAAARRQHPLLASRSERVPRVRAPDAARARGRAATSSSGRPTRTLRPTSSSARATSTRRPTSRAGRRRVARSSTIPNDWDLDAAARATEEAMRAGADVDLPGLLRRRRLARVRRLRRAAAGRPLRGRRHEARAALEARLRAPALLLLRAGRADPGLAARADARRARHARAREPARRRLPRLLPPRARAVRRARSTAGIDVYPLPVSFCDRCDFLQRCEARWRADDHLSLVARMRRDQVRRLEAAGIATVDAARATRPTRRGRRRWRRARSRRCATRRRCRSPRAPNGHAWKVLDAGAGARVRAAAGAERRRPLLRHRGRPVLGARARARVPLGDRRHRAARSARSGRTTARRSGARSRA